MFTSDVLERLDKLLHAEITLEELERPTLAPVLDEAPQSQPKSAGFKSSFKRIGASEEPAINQCQGAPAMGGDDVDGEAMEDDVDGEAFEEDVDGEAMEDVDGEPLGDVDGEAMDGIDGEPAEEV